MWVLNQATFIVYDRLLDYIQDGHFNDGSVWDYFSWMFFLSISDCIIQSTTAVWCDIN